jgi:predicted nucleic acid-binding protein
MRAIADTGFLVAFANRRDQHHAWALEIAERITEPLLTCEAVLAETAFHLASASLVLEFVREGLVRPVFVVAEHLPRLTELAARYSDRQPDLADLCLIRLSELHPKYPVVTTDLSDFRVYRRGRREAIPLVHPPLTSSLPR